MIGARGRRPGDRFPTAALAALTLLAACGGRAATSGGDAATPASAAGVCRARDYWPTDGWRSATPAAEGMDSALLDSTVARIPQRHPNVYALLVVRHGYVVTEDYFGGHNADESFDLRSATKSVTSILVGIAIAHHALLGVDQRIVDVLPSALVGDSIGERKRRITLRHLLTMTSGLEWSESQAPGYLARAPAWAPAILARPMVAEPGRRFNYSSGNAHLLSAAIERVTHTTAREFGNTSLFGPLGFQVPVLDWPADPSGVNAGGSGLRLTAREMAKLGYLYLNDGCWNGASLVPASWVRESVRAWSDPGGRGGTRYGYLWWLATLQGHAGYMAAGYGGQYIVVVPDLDLVVALTADPSPPAANAATQFEVVREVVRAAGRE